MSRGLGRVEMAIAAAFVSRPDHHFSVVELAAAAFPSAKTVDKRHRVSVLRAADRVAGATGWRKTMSGKPRQAVYRRDDVDTVEAAQGSEQTASRKEVDPAIAEAVAANVIAFLHRVTDPASVVTFVRELDRTTVEHLKRQISGT